MTLSILRSQKIRMQSLDIKQLTPHFFGYKTHLAMSEERIITAATITTGEKADGKQLEALIEKSITAGMNVENVIGDAAYSEKGNIKYCLLYTSDAADDLTRVDLGGRRIIKK